MPASAIYLLDLKGKILISRSYRGDIPISAVNRFINHLLQDEELNISPVIEEEGISYIYVRHQNVYCM